MSKIGIVIRTYNEAALLPRTLDAVLSQAEQSFEIVLVDSGSTDATLEIARRYERVKIIEIQKKEFTYGRALNIGIDSIADRVNYVAMLSAHAIPCDESWLSQLVAPMKSNSRVVGVYGKQVVLPEHLSNSVVRALAAESYPTCYGDEAFITNSSYFFSNVNAAIRSNSWLEIKFDESLCASEDWYWAKAAIGAGGWIAYQPSAKVYHSHADTFRDYFVRFYREVKGARAVDPLSNPLISRQECMRKVKDLWAGYLHDSIRRRSLNGLHWDLLRTRAVRALAAYKGRKDVKIE